MPSNGQAVRDHWTAQRAAWHAQYADLAAIHQALHARIERFRMQQRAMTRDERQHEMDAIHAAARALVDDLRLAQAAATHLRALARILRTTRTT
jgi:hypothetical protein